MSSILSLAQEQALTPRTPGAYRLAVVTGVHEDGLALRFDGKEDPDEKHFRFNASCTFAAGQRVYVVKISGSYLVVCPIGPLPAEEAAETQSGEAGQ